MPRGVKERLLKSKIQIKELGKRGRQFNMGNQQTTAENSNIRALPIITSFLIAGFIGLFSETALNMALKDLITGFDILETTAQWLTTGYLLTLGILVPISGLILQWFTTRQLLSHLLYSPLSEH